MEMHSIYSGSYPAALVRAAICVYGLLFLAGCNGNSEQSLGKLVSVQGKITLNDGTALPGGRVLFVPIERDPNALSPHTAAGRIPPTSVGHIEEDGSYKLSTNGQEGVPLGKYRVVLSRGAADRKAWIQVHPQYTSQQKSPLEVEVVENKPERGYDLKLLPRNVRRP
jgi:hypothetical protein